MSYRKLKADQIFNGLEMLADKVLVVKDDSEAVSIINEKDAGDDVETFTGILTPGFVNAHCHLELSHMKGLIPEKTGLIDFVYKVINERHFEEEEILEGIKIGEEEMLQNGIVAVGDICNNILTVTQKLERNLTYYNFIEATGWMPSLARLRWERSKICYDEFSRHFAASIVPHAAYSVSDDLWEKISEVSAGKTITIHNQETAFENEFFLKGTGDFIRMYEKLGIDNSFFSPSNKTSLQTYFHKLSKAASVILVHNVFISQEDIDYANASKPAEQLLSYCLCANANLYIENALPPVEMLEKNNCNIVLGTDSLASNHTLSILEEMKTLQQSFSFLSLEQMLKWATSNGSKALQMNETFGSFEEGKKPGIVLIENCEGGKLNKSSSCVRLI